MATGIASWRQGRSSQDAIPDWPSRNRGSDHALTRSRKAVLPFHSPAPFRGFLCAAARRAGRISATRVRSFAKSRPSRPQLLANAENASIRACVTSSQKAVSLPCPNPGAFFYPRPALVAARASERGDDYESSLLRLCDPGYSLEKLRMVPRQVPPDAGAKQNVAHSISVASPDRAMWERPWPRLPRHRIIAAMAAPTKNKPDAGFLARRGRASLAIQSDARSCVNACRMRASSASSTSLSSPRKCRWNARTVAAWPGVSSWSSG